MRQAVIGSVWVYLCLASILLGQQVEPIGRHQLDAAAYAKQPSPPVLAGIETAAFNPITPRAPGVGPCSTVYGYLPYWNRTATLRYDLLTDVALFSFGASASGTLSNPSGWPWTSVVNAAHAAGVRVSLVITQFDAATTLSLITTQASKEAFFTNVTALLQSCNADGLNIDFEGSGTYRSYINGFMAELTEYVHSHIPGCQVTFAGPAVNWSSSWDLPGLAASCDGIFIMGYDFYWKGSSTSGPSAPLTGGTYNITNTVNTQYAQVKQTMPDKLILGVPYYGNHWTTQTSSARSTKISYVGSLTFASAMSGSQTYGLLWEASSQTPWYCYSVSSVWHQVWFDNAQSLQLKYRLSQTAGLQGVGMWCLGNDAGRTELWDLLQQEYVTNARQATLVTQSYPATMVADSTATAYVELRNAGAAKWRQGAVRLGTWNAQDRVSAFYTAGDWIDDRRPTEMDGATCLRDGTARFTFTLTAPRAPGIYTESWRLVEENVAWFGPTDVQFQITVTPHAVPGDYDGDRDVDQEDFGKLQACLTDAGVLASADCLPGDINYDNYVDYRDVNEFVTCVTGPGEEGDVYCGQ